MTTPPTPREQFFAARAAMLEARRHYLDDNTGYSAYLAAYDKYFYARRAWKGYDAWMAAMRELAK